jgi:hypothetical protein
MRRGTSPTRRLVLSASGALLLPLAARAQLAKQRRIGILANGSRAGAVNWEAFWQSHCKALPTGSCHTRFSRKSGRSSSRPSEGAAGAAPRGTPAAAIVDLLIDVTEDRSGSLRRGLSDGNGRGLTWGIVFPVPVIIIFVFKFFLLCFLETLYCTVDGSIGLRN